MKYQVFVAFLTAVFSGLCFAEDNAPPAGSELWLLAKYDANGDHVISMDEVTEKRDKMFGYMDEDADGEVSFDEYQGLDIRKRQLLLKARFNRLDLDHDGQLSGEEYRSYLGSFERFDIDGDGKVTEGEMSPKALSDTAKTKAKSENLCLLWVCVRTKLD